MAIAPETRAHVDGRAIPGVPGGRGAEVSRQATSRSASDTRIFGPRAAGSGLADPRRKPDRGTPSTPRMYRDGASPASRRTSAASKAAVPSGPTRKPRDGRSTRFGRAPTAQPRSNSASRRRASPKPAWRKSSCGGFEKVADRSHASVPRRASPDAGSSGTGPLLGFPPPQRCKQLGPDASSAGPRSALSMSPSMTLGRLCRSRPMRWSVSRSCGKVCRFRIFSERSPESNHAAPDRRLCLGGLCPFAIQQPAAQDGHGLGLVLDLALLVLDRHDDAGRHVGDPKPPSL